MLHRFFGQYSNLSNRIPRPFFRHGLYAPSILSKLRAQNKIRSMCSSSSSEKETISEDQEKLEFLQSLLTGEEKPKLPTEQEEFLAESGSEEDEVVFSDFETKLFESIQKGKLPETGNFETQLKNLNLHSIQEYIEKRNITAEDLLEIEKKDLFRFTDTQRNLLKSFEHLRNEEMKQKEKLKSGEKKEQDKMLSKTFEDPLSKPWNVRLESFNFEEKHVGLNVTLNEEEIEKYFPDGFAGAVDQSYYFLSEELELKCGFGWIYRPEVPSIIQTLQEAQKNNFLHSVSPSHMILDGARGSGKSIVLSQIVHWARKNDWLVIFIPSAMEWVNPNLDEIFVKPSPEFPGYFDQPIQMDRFIEFLLKAHNDKFEKIRLKLKLNVPEFEGKTMKDLLEFLLETTQYKGEAFSHFRKEISLITEYPVLIAIDEINAFWNVTPNIPDPDSVGPRFLPSRLHANKLTVAKYFMKFQNHGLINGISIVSTSDTSSSKNFLQDPVVASSNHRKPISPLTLSHFHPLIKWYESIEFVEEVDARARQAIYYMAQGKGHQIFDYCKKLYANS